MHTELLTNGIINTAIALLIIGLSIPLVRRKIKMNSLYGVRLTKSFVSDENWYAINHYGGKAMIYWMLPLLVAGISTIISSFFIPPTTNVEAIWIGTAGIPTLLLIGSIIQVVIWSKHLPSKSSPVSQP